MNSPTYGVLWAGPHDSQFSDVIISTLIAGQSDTGPSYGFVQARDASGEYITNMHVWGRHHYGVWSDPLAYGIHLGNVVVEGAFLANVVLATGSTWAGGECFGTNGNDGTQPREVGISYGIARNAPHAPPTPETTNGFQTTSTSVQSIRVYQFLSPGACIDFTNGAGANILSAVAPVAQATALSRGSAHPNDNVLLLTATPGLNLIRTVR